MERIERLTLDLLRCTLTGETPDVALSDETLKAIYRCANRYDLAHCVGYVLERSSLLPKNDVGNAFRKKQTEAIWRTEQQGYECEQIGEVLEEAGIAHIFLKGAVLRRLYPQPWLRTGADVDVLVRKAEQETAIMLLCRKLGCTLGLRTPHDAKLLFPSGQNAELHVLLSGKDFADEVLSSVWQTSIPVEGKQWERALSPEIFYVYHIAHMAKHFEQGGCGIRPLMDLWIMEQTMPRDEKATNALLCKTKLLAFAETAECLKNHWFSEGEDSALAQRMGDYILCGGVFGSVEKKVAVDQIKTGGRMKNFITRVFLPYETMAEVYPPLKTHPWKLPYYELCRWCRLLFRGSAESVWTELRNNQTITKETIRTTEMLLKDLDLL